MASNDYAFIIIRLNRNKLTFLTFFNICSRFMSQVTGTLAYD